MFFIITLLNKIKKDKEVRENNYDVIREINQFLELYANCGSEKQIEEALKMNKQLKEYVDAYLLNLSTKEIAALIAQTDSTKNNQQTQQKQHTKKPPYNKGQNIERSM